MTNLQIVLNTPKNLYLNQGTKNKYLLKFSYLKNLAIENFKPKTILRSSLSLEIRSTPLPHPQVLLKGPRGRRRVRGWVLLVELFCLG